MSTLHTPPSQKLSPRPPSDATRHLCAGVHLDERFRDFVIGRICTSPHRRTAPSYGFDLLPVMRHAWWAAHLSALPRLAVPATLVIPFLLGHTVTGLVTVCGLLLCVLFHHAQLLSSRIATNDPLSFGPSPHSKPGLRHFLENWRRRTTDQRRSLRRIGACAFTVFIVAIAAYHSSPSQGEFGLCLLITLMALVSIMSTITQAMINHIQRAPRLRHRRPNSREKVIDRQQDHDCVVYRRPPHTSQENERLTLASLFGEESPFVGAGKPVYQWEPLLIPLLRPGDDEKIPLHEREHETPPFRPHQLVDRLRRELEALRNDEENVRLPVEVRERIYIAETEVSSDRSLLTERDIDRRRKRSIIDGDVAKGLHFIEVSVPSHGSGLVTTVLLHVRVRGRTLSLFCVTCALTRLPDHFRKAEEYGQSGKRALLSALMRGVFRFPQEIYKSLRLPLYVCFLFKALLLPSDLTLKPIRNIRIGTRDSVREKHAQDWNRAQLDQHDVHEHMKTVELRMLNATSDFLVEHDVDISEFNSRAHKIIQNSFNIGNNNTIHGSALGNGAQANNTGTGTDGGTSSAPPEGQQ